jgi:hypothetical protein
LSSPNSPFRRTLLYFPVIHTQADMGALGDCLERIKVSRFGRRRVTQSAIRVDEMWQEIEQTVESLPIVAGKVRIYQDGLPVCGHEMQIVSDLAQAGSRNHRLLLRLASRGAILMGTESPELLIEEYHLATTSLASLTAAGARRFQHASATLLENRDRYISHRIGTTLQTSETGILFLGMLHNAQTYLASDIEVRYPFPGWKEGYERKPDLRQSPDRR